jgi:hypothetical protein
MQDLTIIDELRAKLTQVKDKLKNDDLTSVAFTEISANAKILQNKLDDLLQKKGIYSQSDIDDAYATLQEFKRRELEMYSKKAKRNTIMIGALFVLGIVLINRALKK